MQFQVSFDLFDTAEVGQLRLQPVGMRVRREITGKTVAQPTGVAPDVLEEFTRGLLIAHQQAVEPDAAPDHLLLGDAQQGHASYGL